MTLPSKYPSSEERQRKGRMLEVFIIAGFVGLIFLPLYFGIKGMFGPDATYYVPVIMILLGWVVRFVGRYFLRSYFR